MMRLREEGQLWADQLCRRASGPSVHQRKFQRSLWIHWFRHTIMKVKDATKDSALPVFWSLSNPQISYQNKFPTDIHKYEWLYWRLKSPSGQCRLTFRHTFLQEPDCLGFVDRQRNLIPKTKRESILMYVSRGCVTAGAINQMLCFGFIKTKIHIGVKLLF